MIHSILIIGQSNMGGRGFKDEVEPIVRVFTEKSTVDNAIRNDLEIL